MIGSCPQIEQLLIEQAEGRGPALEHARLCERCSQLLEEHRQLERELFRLSDPFPPLDFTRQVMAKVAAQPAPMRINLGVGLAIAAIAFALGLIALVAAGAGPSTVGSLIGSTLIIAKSLWVGSQKSVSLLWATESLPMAISLFAILLICVFALRRLVAHAPALSEARISG